MRRLPILGSNYKPLESFFIVRVHAFTSQIQLSKLILSLHAPALRRTGVITQSFFNVPLNPERRFTIQIYFTHIAQSVCMSLLGGSTKPSHCFSIIGLHHDTHAITPEQYPLSRSTPIFRRRLQPIDITCIGILQSLLSITCACPPQSLTTPFPSA